MHPAAHDFVARQATGLKPANVIEIGSLDINGNVRGLFPDAKSYVGVDLVAGRGVDVVADATTWKPKRRVQVVVCCEMIEHCETWREVIYNIADHMLTSPGVLFLTAAGPTREPHSGIDGGVLRPDEFYENIDPVDLESVLVDAGFIEIELYEPGDDIHVVATLP
jgi:hypothetical protein